MVKQAAEMLPPRSVSPDASTDEHDYVEVTPPRPNKRHKNQSGKGMSGVGNGMHTPTDEVKQPRKPKQATSTVPDTLNVPWSEEELERLEQLMKIIPDEAISSYAAALGTRTDKQVGSRIQRLMNKENYNGNTKLNLSQSTYRVTAPSILMPDETTVNRVTSHEKPVTVHYGFSCDGCQVEPIVGIRWKCLDCPEAEQVDLCDSCHRIGEFENAVHRVEHKYEAWTEPEPGDGAAVSHSNNDTNHDYAYLGLGT
ncbi:hypothetical protein BDF22DRAFT_687981 [Syncephalis plumigaleata]|nr:hypothetical protein BDF22DRAFT_687981 [Syncephalis plumigaleata]